MSGSVPTVRAPAAAEPGLEELIRAAAAAGELTHLSVVPVAGKGPKGVSWSASYSPASTFGAGFAVAADPVEAIKAAMRDRGHVGRVVGKIERELAKAPAAEVEAAQKRVKARKGKAPAETPALDDSAFMGE